MSVDEDSKYQATIAAPREDDPESPFDREAKGTLPDGLQLVALEFSLLLPRAKTDADYAVWESLERTFETFGSNCVSVHGKDKSLFGAPAIPIDRLRFDIITTPALIEKWGLTDDPEQSRFLRSLSGNIVSFKHHRVKKYSSVAFRYDQTFEENELFSPPFQFKLLLQEHFQSGEEFLPGDFANWARAVQTTDGEFERFAALADACNGDLLSVGTALDRLEAKPEPQSFLVHGLIPRGALTLLLGNKKVGKSAMALELAVAVALREPTWLGFPLDVGQGGFAAYTHGEDSAGTVLERVELMTGGETPYLLHSIPADQGDIDDVLARLERQKVALLVIDPARKYFRGDEDGSDAVSEFFGKLETFAREKNCAVLVTHHLKRNAFPKNLAEVATLYRGSSVFLDRPRVTLATLRAGNETQFGIPAPDGVPLHNFLASTMFSGVCRLRREESTFRHVPIGGQTPSVNKAPTTAEAQTVLAAIGDVLASGKKITRTGKAGIFELKLQALAGMPRTAVRSAVDNLVRQGALDIADEGMLTLPAVPVETAPADLVG